MSFDAATHQFPGAAAAKAAVKQQDVASCCHERHSPPPAHDAVTDSLTQPSTSSDYKEQCSPILHPAHDAPTGSFTQQDTSSDDAAAATSSVTPPDTSSDGAAAATNSGNKEQCSPNSTRNAAAATNPSCHERQSLHPAHDAAAATSSVTPPDTSSDGAAASTNSSWHEPYFLHPAHDAATSSLTLPDTSSDDAAATTNPSCYERHSPRPAHDAAAATSSVTPPDTSSDDAAATTNPGHKEQCSQNSTRNAAALHPSAALLEANQRLLAAQAQIKKERFSEQRGIAAETRPNQGQPAAAGEIEDAPFATGKEAPSGLTHETSSNAAAIIAALPEHLGWESATVSALLRHRTQTSTRDTGRHVVTQGPRLVADPCVGGCGGDESHAGSGCVSSECLEGRCVEGSVVNPYAKNAPQLPEWVKLYPGLGVGLLRRNLTAPGRLWLFLRALDSSGQGRLPFKATRDALVTATSPLRFCGVRQWRNLLRAGEGIFWTWDETNIWLKATAKVALALGVGRLTGQPVAFPIAALREGVGLFRAHLYAAFHSGRSKETVRGRTVMPLARATLTELSGVGASSQRTYEKQTHLKVQANFAVGEVATTENRENRAWQQGQAVFTLTDYRGRQGPKGQSYLAWQLPNSYFGQHPHRPKGRQKRINRELKDLVMQGMPGNRGKTVATQRIDRRYFPNGKEALETHSQVRDIYWQRHGMAGVRQWWQVIQR